MDKIEKEKSSLDADKLFVLFQDMIQMCLWYVRFGMTGISNL